MPKVPVELASTFPKQSVPFVIGQYHLDRLQGMHIRDYEHDGKHPFRIFAIVTVLLLIVVTINFVNVLITQNVARTKEVIVRKITGAERYSIVGMFYAEVLTIACISIAVSLGISVALVGLFEAVLSINVDISTFVNPRFVSIAALSITLIVAIGGLYPLAVLSKVRAVPLLPNDISQSKFARHVGQIVLAVQFSISTALVMCVIVMNGQLTHVQTDDLAFNPRDVITFDLEPSEAGSYAALRNDLIGIAGVDNVGASSIAIFDDVPPITMLKRSDSSVTLVVSVMSVDSAFISTLDIKRTSQAIAKGGFLINKAAATGFSIGRDWNEFSLSAGAINVPIVGIVDNFNFTDKRRRISPLAISVADDSAKVFSYTGCSVYVRLSESASAASTLSAITRTYQQHFPGKVPRSEYLNDKIIAMYAAEHSMLKAFTLFSTIGVIVSLFGAVGLLTFNIAARMAGLSIRKLWGAGPSHLSYFLSKDTGIAVMVGATIGVVAAYYFLHDWLNAFAYHISIGPRHILICLLLTLSAILVVSAGFVLRAVNTNPVVFLRKGQ